MKLCTWGWSRIVSEVISNIHSILKRWESNWWIEGYFPLTRQYLCEQCLLAEHSSKINTVLWANHS